MVKRPGKRNCGVKLKATMVGLRNTRTQKERSNPLAQDYGCHGRKNPTNGQCFSHTKEVTQGEKEYGKGKREILERKGERKERKGGVTPKSWLP